MRERQVSELFGTHVRAREFVRPFLAAALVLGMASAAAAELESAPEGVDARSVALAAEENLRGDRTYVEMRMTITSPRLSRPRTVEMRSWEDRPGKRSFIRIDSPAKDAGTGFLKLHPNLWMYIPRVERTVRIPPSMMLQSWMGSDFSNDDLVRESSAIDDYDHRLLGVERNVAGAPGRSAYVVEYLPHEDAPVVWGRIVAWIDTQRSTPMRQEFYQEDGELVRVMTFSDPRSVGDRYVPHRWALVPLDKPGHETVIELKAIRFDADLDDSIFTTRNLKSGR